MKEAGDAGAIGAQSIGRFLEDRTTIGFGKTSTTGRRPFVLAIALAGLSLTAGAAPVRADAGRALANYQALLRGQKQFHDLTPAERAEVIEFDRQLRRERAVHPSETREDCMERLSKGGTTALENNLIALKCSQRSSRGD